MSAIWILQLKLFRNGKQKSRPVLKIVGLQKLLTNEKRLSPLLMKKCDIHCTLDSQSLVSFMKTTYLTSKLSQLLNFVRVWSINHIIARVSRFFWRRQYIKYDNQNNVPHFTQTEKNGRGPCEPSLISYHLHHSHST